MRLILASGSPARASCSRKRATHSRSCRRTSTNQPAQRPPISYYVHQVAWLKAAAVAPHVPEGTILAADTVGWLDGKVIGKPSDEADARRILTTLGGREHELWTGVVLWQRPGDLQTCCQEMTRVAFKRLSPQELDAYLATRQWQGCSGAYAIEEHNDPFVRVVEGSLTNVIGLPMESLRRVLSDQQII